MILKLLLNTQMTWMIFVKTLKNTTQIKKRKILIDDMIPDMFNNNNKKNRIIYQIQKAKHFYCFYYTVLLFCFKKYYIKFYRLSYYGRKLERELQQIAFNYSSDIDFKDFMNL